MNKSPFNLCVALLLGLSVASKINAQTDKIEVLGTVRAEVGGGAGLISVADISRDGKRLLLSLDSLPNGGSGAVLVDVATGKSIRDFPDAAWQMQTANLSPSGKFALLTRQQMGAETIVRLNLIDCETGKPVYEYTQHFGAPHGAVSVGDQFLVHTVEVQPEFKDAEQHVRGIRLSDGRQLWDRKLEKASDGSPQFMWSPDAKQIFVTRYSSQKCAVVSAEDGSTVFTVQNDDKDPLDAWRFSQDSKTLAAVYQSGLCVLYGTETGRVISSTTSSAQPQLYQVLTPDLKWLISPQNGIVGFSPLFSGGTSVSVKTGPRPTSLLWPSADGSFGVISIDGNHGGDLMVIRLPRPDAIAPSKIPSTQPRHDGTTQPTTHASSSGETSDWKNPVWWCNLAEQQTALLPKDAARARADWRMAAIKARLGDLPAAMRLLSAANAIQSVSGIQTDWRGNERLIAYYWIARETARTKSLVEAQLLLDTLSESDRTSADWMPAAALATGRAEAQDVASARRLIDPLRGEQRAEVTSRVINILIAASRINEAAGLVELMPNGMDKTMQLAKVCIRKVDAGDFGFALNSLNNFALYSPQNISLEGPLVTFIASRATRTGNPEIVAQLRSHQKPLRPADIDLGCVRGYLAAGKSPKAIELIEKLDAHSKQELRGVVAAHFAKTGDLTAIFSLYSGEPDTYWAGGTLTALVRSDRLDAAVQALGDPRLAKMDPQIRTISTQQLIQAFLKADRVDEADKLFSGLVSQGFLDRYTLQAQRAGALRRGGRVHESNEVLAKLIKQLNSDSEFPPELMDFMLMSCAADAGDFELVSEKLLSKSIQAHMLHRRNFLSEAAISAIKSRNSALLAKLIPLFESSTSGPVGTDSSYSPIATALLTDQIGVVEFHTFVNQLPSAMSRSNALLAAAELLLAPDPAEERYPKWDQ